MATTIDLDSFLAERTRYLVDAAARRASRVDFGAARMHYETTDAWASLSGCREWRGCIRMSALDANPAAPEVEVGVVQFLILQAGYESPAETLPLFGDRAASFAELFDAEWLRPELDESDDFTGGMPISAVLVVLDAVVDDRIDTDSGLRAWAVAETIHTMLPTTAGLVLMPALFTAAKPKHRLVSSELLDADWPRVGCVSVPGHPGFYGQATSYVYLEDARDALAAVRERPVGIPLDR
ncbi:hypothetical protein [Mycolicibacterium sp. J2]|uniref:hypothetical protein n=1 Tax=Mycolicibacterium sp. J2 TaxID=2993511 RepID=UPI00224A7A56|nr:hypothetical protein [Mycolicibacterium sp. J2]MCX2715851.1 hypothetical protein [Mycolicibacterium sp. J2]